MQKANVGKWVQRGGVFALMMTSLVTVGLRWRRWRRRERPRSSSSPERHQRLAVTPLDDCRYAGYSGQRGRQRTR